MSKTTAKLRIDFARKLPPDLGKPYIMNTTTPPFVCVAFYAAQIHELHHTNISGNEFILADYGNGGRTPETLHGIIGIDEMTADLVCCALVSHGTTKRKLKPYGDMVYDMVREAANRSYNNSYGDPYR